MDPTAARPPGSLGGRAARALVFEPRPHRLVAGAAAARLGLGQAPDWGSPLRLREVRVPLPFGPDWVELEPRFAGICGSDLHQVRLEADADNPLSALVSFPHVPGHEVVAQVRGSGEWVALDPWLGCRARGGDCCARCAEGLQALCERVTEPVVPGRTGTGLHLGNVRGLPGGFGTAMLAHRSQCLPLPGGLEPAAAVLADPLAVALHAVERAGFDGEGVALVLGAGTIGLCAAAVLRLRHPRARVLVSAAWPHLCERVRELGAEPLSTDPRVVVEAVAAAAGGRPVKPWLGPPWLAGSGAAVVIDAIGSGPTGELALRAVRTRGRVVRVGVGRAARQQTTLAYYKELEVVGSNGYRGGDLARALELLAGGDVPHRRWRTHTFPLERWRDAFAVAGSPRRSESVKVTLRVGAADEEVAR